MDDRKGKEKPTYMKNRKDKREQMAPLYGLTGGQVITLIPKIRMKIIISITDFAVQILPYEFCRKIVAVQILPYGFGHANSNG
jgi:hypothetical protein